MMRKHFLVIIIFAAILSGCADVEPAQESAIATQADIEETIEPTQTEITIPTDTEPPPTHTAEPPTPTQTPELPTPTPLPFPDPRWMHHLVYNQAANVFILFGGSTGVPCDYRSDTWTYDLSTNTWIEMNPPEAPPESQGTMAYDVESDRVVLFIGTLAGESTGHGEGGAGGGSNCIPYDDLKTATPGGETWVYDYDNNEWSKMETTEGPFGLKGAEMVYNSAADRMILFGGYYVGDGPNSGGSSETWVYDLNSNSWTEVSPAVSPPGRMHHAMAYDAESDRVIIWGGGGPRPMDVGDIWAFNLNENTWEELESDEAPRALQGGEMVYDALNDRTLLYFRKEFWAYDLNNNLWTLLTDSPDPLGLLWHSLVYDTSNDLILQFGGGPNFGQWLRQLWIFDPEIDQWTEVNTK